MDDKISEREQRTLDDPRLMASIQRGLKDAEEGRLIVYKYGISRFYVSRLRILWWRITDRICR